MAFDFDPLSLVYLASAIIAGIVGFFSIRNEIRKSKAEDRQVTYDHIKAESTGIKSFIDERMNLVDEKFETVKTRIDQGTENLKELKTDFKQLTIDFKSVVDKVSNNSFILENTMPEFRKLKNDFYDFREAVNKNIVSKDKSAV